MYPVNSAIQEAFWSRLLPSRWNHQQALTGVTGALQNNIFPLNALPGLATFNKRLVSQFAPISRRPPHHQHACVVFAAGRVGAPRCSRRDWLPTPGASAEVGSSASWRTSSALFIQLMAFTSSSLTDGGVLREHETEAKENQIKKKKKWWVEERKENSLKKPHNPNQKKVSQMNPCPLVLSQLHTSISAFLKCLSILFMPLSWFKGTRPESRRKKKKTSSLLKCFQK